MLKREMREANYYIELNVFHPEVLSKAMLVYHMLQSNTRAY